MGWRPLPGLVFILLLFLCGSTPSWSETLVLVSDLNGRYGSTSYHQRVDRAAARIVDLQPDLVISAGDMVAGQAPSGLDDATLKAMWSAFAESFITPLGTAGIPLAVTAGNHDGSAYPGFERDRQAFERHWRDRPPPGLLPGSEWPWRYAVRHGDLLAITFDGTLPGEISPGEREFVARMLDDHGEAAAWTVVWSHLPFWPLAQNRQREIISDAGFLDLLHENGVDAYVSGHHHLYYAGVDEAGMLHVSIAALGGNARRFASGGGRQGHGLATLSRLNGQLVVDGWLAPDFRSSVNGANLPETIEGPVGTLHRVKGPVDLRD